MRVSYQHLFIGTSPCTRLVNSLPLSWGAMAISTHGCVKPKWHSTLLGRRVMELVTVLKQREREERQALTSLHQKEEPLSQNEAD